MNVYTWFTYSTCVYLRKTFEFHRNTLGKSLRLFENARPRQRGTPFHQFENDEGSGVFASGGGLFIRNSKDLWIIDRNMLGESLYCEFRPYHPVFIGGGHIFRPGDLHV